MLADLVVAAGLGGEQLDDLVLDEGRVDVEHHQSLRPSPEAVGLDRDVDAALGAHLDESPTEVVDRRAEHA